MTYDIANVKGWKARSWLLRSTITGEKLKTLSRILWAIAGIGSIAAGIAIAFASSAQELWRPLAIVGSLVGMLGFAVFWDGQVKRSVNQGALGLVIDLIILLSAITVPQAFS
jgi:hypothetical protein